MIRLDHGEDYNVFYFANLAKITLLALIGNFFPAVNGLSMVRERALALGGGSNRKESRGADCEVADERKTFVCTT